MSCDFNYVFQFQATSDNEINCEKAGHSLKNSPRFALPLTISTSWRIWLLAPHFWQCFIVELPMHIHYVMYIHIAHHIQHSKWQAWQPQISTISMVRMGTHHDQDVVSFHTSYTSLMLPCTKLHPTSAQITHMELDKHFYEIRIAGGLWRSVQNMHTTCTSHNPSKVLLGGGTHYSRLWLHILCKRTYTNTPKLRSTWHVDGEW